MPIEKFDKTKNVAVYECEECGSGYASEAEALECEDSHLEDEHRH